ncbi:hypothetical protein KSD_63060 [Ktedonobacter sp. SOSP1-85]|nr:hypothetical protein KSD_63060 [Ktedonobacter sp. SOSP1-85]
MVFLLFDVVVFSDVMLMQIEEPSALLYWILGACIFLFPAALVLQWLIKRLPGQGSFYAWTSLVFGTVPGFIATFSVWITGMILTAASIENTVGYLRILKPGWLAMPVQQGIAMMIVLLLVTGISCIPLIHLKKLLFYACICYCALYIILGVDALLWLLHGHHSAQHWTQPENWLLMNSNVQHNYSVVMLSFLGVNHPLFLGNEVRGGEAGLHRASSYVWWGSVITLLLHLLATMSASVFLFSHPTNELQAGFELSFKELGSRLAPLAVVVLAGAAIFQAVVFMFLFARLLVTLAQHQRAPSSFARAYLPGVPLLSLLLQALVIGIVLSLGFILLPSLFGENAVFVEMTRNAYQILLAGASVILLGSMVLIFLLPVLIVYHRPLQHELSLRVRPKHIFLLLVALMGVSASLLGIWTTLSASWITTLSNKRWSSIVLIVVLVILLLSWLCGESPRLRTLAHYQQDETTKEQTLREQLQEAYQQQEVLLSELDRLYREQALAALTDPVTGLPNHRAVMNALEAAFKAATTPFAIIFMDLDHFKNINDRWGHRAGDAILHEVGQRLRAGIRAGDFIGRYGGEEFAVLCHNVTLAQASEMAQQLQLTLARHPCSWHTEGQTHNIVVTISIGIALYPLHTTTQATLLELADLAMYQAKQAGRNCICIASTRDEQV